VGDFTSQLQQQAAAAAEEEATLPPHALASMLRGVRSPAAAARALALLPEPAIFAPPEPCSSELAAVLALAAPVRVCGGEGCAPAAAALLRRRGVRLAIPLALLFACVFVLAWAAVNWRLLLRASGDTVRAYTEYLAATRLHTRAAGPTAAGAAAAGAGVSDRLKRRALDSAARAIGIDARPYGMH
jgi:hypothetical protein